MVSGSEFPCCENEGQLRQRTTKVGSTADLTLEMNHSDIDKNLQDFK